ncbi:MAG: YfbK domain-containing protein [Planctomycetota bacterium]|jgi:Ca-activated chloride channel family protein
MSEQKRLHCEQAEMMLAAYHFGELDTDAPETQAFLKHIESCDACRAKLDSLAATAGLLEGALAKAPAPTLSADRRSALLALNASLFDGENATATPARRAKRRIPLDTRYRALLATAASVMIIGGLVGSLGVVPTAKDAPMRRKAVIVMTQIEEAIDDLAGMEEPYGIPMGSGNPVAARTRRIPAKEKPLSLAERALSDADDDSGADNGLPVLQGLPLMGRLTNVPKTRRPKSTKHGSRASGNFTFSAPELDDAKVIQELEEATEDTYSADTGVQQMGTSSLEQVVTKSHNLMDQVVVNDILIDGLSNEKEMKVRRELEMSPEEVYYGPTVETDVSVEAGEESDGFAYDGTDKAAPNRMGIQGRFAKSKKPMPFNKGFFANTDQLTDLRKKGEIKVGGKLEMTLENMQSDSLKNVAEERMKEMKASEPELAIKSITPLPTPKKNPFSDGQLEVLGGERSSQRLPSRESFGPAVVNPFVMAAKDRFSTFALDVDTAAYNLTRQYIRAGYKPPAGAVRTEEFLNAFHYNYPDQSAKTFQVHCQAMPSPFGTNLALLKIGVKARTVGRENQRPAHLTFVIDSSGSMERADRLPLIKRSIKLLLTQLGPVDRVSLVTYGDEARALMEFEPAEHRERIVKTLDSIRAVGSTNLGKGLKIGMQLASQNYHPRQINSVILCSDGVANVGETESQSILSQVATYRRQGITQNTVGFGAGAYNDRIMEELANRGDGQYLFIDSVEEAQKTFQSQFGDAIRTVARDAKIQVEWRPEAVRRYRLLGYENRKIKDKDFRNDAIDAGEVGSGQSVTVLYEVELNEPLHAYDPSTGDLGTVFVRCRDDRSKRIIETATRLSRRLIQRHTVESAPRLHLAAAVAEFAEILRGSEYAETQDLRAVESMVSHVQSQLPLDRKIQELQGLVRAVRGLPEAP